MLICCCFLNTIIVIAVEFWDISWSLLCYTQVSVLVSSITRGQYYWILHIRCLAWYRSNLNDNSNAYSLITLIPDKASFVNFILSSFRDISFVTSLHSMLATVRLTGNRMTITAKPVNMQTPMAYRVQHGISCTAWHGTGVFESTSTCSSMRCGRYQQTTAGRVGRGRVQATHQHHTILRFYIV